MLIEMLPSSPKKQTPNRIRQVRKHANLSQQALADRIGVSKVTISSLETGKMRLSLKYMQRISMALSVPAVDLLNESEQNAILCAKEMELVRAYRAASTIQRELIHRIAAPL